MYTVKANYSDGREVVNSDVPTWELAIDLRDRHYDNGAVAVFITKHK